MESHGGQPEEKTEERFLPRWVLYAAIPGILAPILILGFIFMSELAHDEARCPYAPIATRALPSGIVIREDKRSCLPDVEERRYTVLRGAQARVLGRRRLPVEAFAGPEYRWDASVSEQGEVHVRVHTPGHPDAQFREGTPEERGEP